MSPKKSKIPIIPLSHEYVEAVLEIEKHTPGSPLNRSLLESELIYPLSRSWVALDTTQRIVGFLIYRLIFDHADILYLAINPKARRQGIATQFLQWMVNQEKTIKQITLEVRSSNEDAQKFYEANGFSVIAKRERYYRDGEDALVMAKTLHR